MTVRTIDLNSDLGERDDLEGVRVDIWLLKYVTSANIACGGHAGSDISMERTVMLAQENGVAIGAHPGYPDRANFGRVECAIPHQQLEDSIAAQIDALLRIVTARRGELGHVKPHGALYHAAMQRRDIAELIARAVTRIGISATLVGQANAPALATWREMGFQVASEAFADRRYEADGSLRARGKPDAMIADPKQAAEQAIRIVRGQGVLTPTGGVVDVGADTLCLHSDTPNAIENARAVRDALAREGIACRALPR